MRKIAALRWLFFVLILLTLSAAASAQVRISVAFGPPALPIYDQPICPGDGYLWTPGYWAWDPDFDDYYWVPGTWVLAPEVGFFWTPPYWGWADGAFVFYDGYWGPNVGFYGGIAYGFGYFGFGFVGGRWDGGHFFYNRTYANIDVVNIHNVYNETVNVNVNNHVSYNGGPGGVDAHPRPQDEAAARDRHVGPVAAQTQQIQAARGNPEFRANNNHGRPPVAATARPGDFRSGAVAAREAGGEYHPNRNVQPRGGNEGRGAPNDVRDLPPAERPGPPNTGDAKQDKKVQKQQEKLYNQQQKERQNLQQQQEKEHQQAEKNHATQEQRQQMEQRHQQQTQQMQQRHSEEMQRAAPAGRPR